MLSEQTHQKLVAMRLLGLAAAFDDYLQERKPDKFTFEERFGLMVDAAACTLGRPRRGRRSVVYSPGQDLFNASPNPSLFRKE
ncbi:MAG: hypothetical protein ABIK83_14205 [Candidatus Zixiibacteriota bacterium]